MKDLLNVLYDHYNAQLPLGTVMPYGWTIVEVNYAVEVNDDGELTGIYALGATSDADEVEDKAKTKAKGKDTPYQKFTVPVRRTRTSGAYPYLFCDAAHYMFGTPKRDGKGKVSTIDYYGAMKNAVLGLREYLGESPALCAIYKFYETWDNTKAEENPYIVASNVANGGQCMFFYNGKPIFEDDVFKKNYEKLTTAYGEMPIPQKDKNGKFVLPSKPTYIRSMISGEVGLKATLFNNVSVNGVNAYLLSNNKKNTNYFGREKGNAIPISQKDGHKICEAAKDLLTRRKNFFIPASKSCNLKRSMVVWCDDVPKEEESVIIDLCFDTVSNSLSISDESGSEMTERMFHIAQIRKGRMIPLSEKEKNVKVNVWTVGTRGKGSIVSDFTQITLGELCEHFQRHYDNMEIVRSPKCKENDGTVRDFARPNTVYRSLFAKDEKGKVKVDNPVLWKQISRSVFMGEKYPTRVLDMVLCRADRESKKTLDDGVCCISATMAGIIKAYLINNAGKEDLTVSLNENNTTPAYLTGRIFCTHGECSASNRPKQPDHVCEALLRACYGEPGRNHAADALELQPTPCKS